MKSVIESVYQIEYNKKRFIIHFIKKHRLSDEYVNIKVTANYFL